MIIGVSSLFDLDRLKNDCGGKRVGEGSGCDLLRQADSVFDAVVCADRRKPKVQGPKDPGPVQSSPGEGHPSLPVVAGKTSTEVTG